MRLFTIEHSVSEYRADFVVYGVAWLSLLAYLTLATPGSMRWSVVDLSIIGVVAWSLVEYLVHRFVLHGLRPFSDWHTAHHAGGSGRYGLTSSFWDHVFRAVRMAPR